MKLLADVGGAEKKELLTKWNNYHSSVWHGERKKLVREGVDDDGARTKASDKCSAAKACFRDLGVRSLSMSMTRASRRRGSSAMCVII